MCFRINIRTIGVMGSASKVRGLDNEGWCTRPFTIKTFVNNIDTKVIYWEGLGDWDAD